MGGSFKGKPKGKPLFWGAQKDCVLVWVLASVLPSGQRCLKPQQGLKALGEQRVFLEVPIFLSLVANISLAQK